PGAGVGGHCLPKDTWLLRYGLRAYGREPLEAELISLARAINDHMPLHMAELARRAIESHGQKMEKSKVVILGVAYLENSDDTRNTPASSLAIELSRLGAKVVAHDPYVKELPGIEILADLFEAARGADALAIVTKHREYFHLDFPRLKQLMRTPLIIDGRAIIKEDEAKRNGFGYSLLGRGR
ncbi:MAG: UDP binding domain-containing protein, partial [bacterium]|nr:UDP binding domain-containing protein [bacterium]